MCTLAMARKRAAVVVRLRRHAVLLRLMDINKTGGPCRLGSPRWLAEDVTTTNTRLSPRLDVWAVMGVGVTVTGYLLAIWGCPGSQGPTLSHLGGDGC